MRTEFIITPVANGWILSIPSLHNENSEVVNMMTTLAEKITNPDRISEVDAVKPEMVRDKTIFVFKEFLDVLRFLEKQINTEPS